MNTFDIPDEQRPLDHGPVRLRVGAAAGVVALAAMTVRIAYSAGFQEQHPLRALAWADAHPTTVFVVNLAETLGFGLLAFACITLTGLVRGRGKWLTQIGGWGLVVTFLAVALNSFGDVVAALHDYPDRRTAAAVIKHAEHSAQLAPLVVLLVASGLFPLLFGLGLCRARLVGWWYAGPVVLQAVLSAVLDASGALALLTVALPTAVVVGVWVKLLLDRAHAVADVVPARLSEPVTA